MASEIFKNFPEITYTLRGGKIVTVKDLFRKVSVSLDNIIDYTYYDLQDGDRPDVVASKLYGDGDLHWTFFLVNDFSNYYEWWRSPSEFEAFITRKYSGVAIKSAYAFEMIDSESKFLMGERVSTSTAAGNICAVQPTFSRLIVEPLGNLGDFVQGQTITSARSNNSFTISEVKQHRDCTAYYTKDGARSNVPQLGWLEVTSYEDELNINEAKRQIRYIKPNLIKDVVSQFEKVLKS